MLVVISSIKFWRKCDMFFPFLSETGLSFLTYTSLYALILFIFTCWCWSTVSQICSVEFWSIFLSHTHALTWFFSFSLIEKFQYLRGIQGNVPSVRSTFLPQHCVSLRTAEFCQHDFTNIWMFWHQPNFIIIYNLFIT